MLIILVLWVLAIFCAILAIYLLLLDSNLLCIVVEWWNKLLTFVDPGDHPFAKALILLAFVALFAILLIIADRQRRNVHDDPAKP